MGKLTNGSTGGRVSFKRLGPPVQEVKVAVC